MKRLTAWVHRITGVTALRGELAHLQKRHDDLQTKFTATNWKLDRAVELLDKHTLAAADVNPMGGTHIITIGRYKGHDHVEVHSVPKDYFEDVIKTLQHIRRQHGRFVMDAPPQVSFLRRL